jgi:DNA-binding PadR family transcriptional regulator
VATAADAPPELELALLGFLRHEAMHAYEIYLRMRHTESLGLVWRLKQGHLYALLARLEDAGYLASSMQQQGARPPRRVLVLTDAGRDAFLEWLSDPVAHGRDFRLTFLAKLYFAAQEKGSHTLVLIARQSAACEHWLADLHTHLDALSPEMRYERLVLAFRATQIEAILRWLDECEATLGIAGGQTGPDTIDS